MDTEYLGIRFTGMKPSEIRAGELAGLLISFEEMITATVQRGRPQIAKNELGIGLVNIQDKSIGLEFATKLPELTVPAYNVIADSIQTEQFLRLSSDTLKYLRDIHAFIRSKNCEGEFFVHNGSLTTKAILLPFMDIPEHPKTTTETIIYGRIMRVGGTKPRVMVESASGKTIYCLVETERLAQEIAERLYSWAGLNGVAILNSDNLEILEFTVKGLTNYEGTHSLLDAISELSVLAGPFYKDIYDVEEYVGSLRE